MDSIKICNRCVMDHTVPGITFSEDSGFCNFCTDFTKKKINDSVRHFKTPHLDQIVDIVRRQGKGKPYDCVVGVSGGVDSSWTLVKVVELGLRPLAVHLDNGWNSELAQHNISNLLSKLNVDLYTHVIDWEEYRSFMQRFFDADVIDVELLYDNAILAINYQVAQKFKLKTILSGSNSVTEGMSMPHGWNWYKFDKTNIQSIAQKRVGLSNSTFPAIGTLEYIYNEFVLGRKWVPFLDYISYDKNEALVNLSKLFDFKPYPHKHYESVFTRFYQGFILPKKFGVDKRRLHLSNLVVSGQLEREAALEVLDSSPYDSERSLQLDKEYFLKKMLWSEKDLMDYISRPEVSHGAFRSEKNLYDGLRRVYRFYSERRV